MTEDLEAVEEELAEARSENERLQMEAADAAARMREMTEALDAARGELTIVVTERDTAAEALRAAVTEYRQAALAAEPALPPDLVGGETVAEVQASLATARTTVEGIRERLAEESATTQPVRVPPGTPARRGIEDGPRSPRDKIAEGLRREQR